MACTSNAATYVALWQRRSHHPLWRCLLSLCLRLQACLPCHSEPVIWMRCCSTFKQGAPCPFAHGTQLQARLRRASRCKRQRLCTSAAATVEAPAKTATVKIGTRGSPLALAQAYMTRDFLKASRQPRMSTCSNASAVRWRCRAAGLQHATAHSGWGVWAFCSLGLVEPGISSSAPLPGQCALTGVSPICTQMQSSIPGLCKQTTPSQKWP